MGPLRQRRKCPQVQERGKLEPSLQDALFWNSVQGQDMKNINSLGPFQMIQWDEVWFNISICLLANINISSHFLVLISKYSENELALKKASSLAGCFGAEIHWVVSSDLGLLRWPLLKFLKPFFYTWVNCLAWSLFLYPELDKIASSKNFKVKRMLSRFRVCDL